MYPLQLQKQKEIEKVKEVKSAKHILIGSQNPHKQKKLSDMVTPHLNPVILSSYPEFDERGDTFEEIAKNKALAYAQRYKCLAISTDGGAVIPALSKNEWDPLQTRRFSKTDQERIKKLLWLMRDKENRVVQWFEAVAIANPKRTLFSATAKATDGVIDTTFNPAFYREGIWLCSVTSFPQFNGRNFFELTPEEQEKTEDSWSELKRMVAPFIQTNLLSVNCAKKL